MKQNAELNSIHEKGSTVYVVAISLVAALGGLLFGYDTAVISGAIGFLEKHYLMDGAMTGWAAGSAIAGCIFGAAVAGKLNDQFGRKKVLIVSAVLFLVSAVGTAIPLGLTEFIIYRIVGGVGVGAASMTSPLYIAEISPAGIRGRMVSLNQFGIVLGMLLVYFVNFYIGDYGVGLNDDLATKTLAEVEINVSNEEKIALSTQVRAQIENYFNSTSADLIDELGIHLQQQLIQNPVEDKQLQNLAEKFHLGIDDNPKIYKWDTKKFCQTISSHLSLYGLTLLESRESEAETRAALKNIAALLTNLLHNPSLDIHAVAESIMKFTIAGRMASGEISPALNSAISVLLPKTEKLGNISWNVQRGWRWMFGSEALPALILLLLLFLVPESPRWSAKQGHHEQARKVLRRIGGTAHAESELSGIETTVSHESESLKQLFKGKMFLALLIGICLAVAQQAKGINVFLYYAPKIFANMGFGTSAALYQTILVGAVNLSFTIVAIWSVDKLGRKPLMLIGSIGMAICMFVIGGAAYFQNTDTWVLFFVLGYIACFALSLGPIVWVYLSELFPTRIRGRAMSIATFTLWISCYLVSQTFPMMDQNSYLIEKFHHAFPFLLYGVIGIATFLFVLPAVPETKGKTLEEIEKMWL